MHLRFSTIIAIAALFIISALVAHNSSAIINATIRAGDCLPSEGCLFTIYDTYNSHAASCDIPTKYPNSVCSPNIYGCDANCTVRATCLAGEMSNISFYDFTNSHLATAKYFSNKLCCKTSCSTVGLECLVTDAATCAAGYDLAAASLYQENDSHVARFGNYSRKMCCKIGITLYNVEVNPFPIAYNYTEVNCTANPANLPTLQAQIIDPDGAKRDCIFQDWIGNKKRFMCYIFNETSDNPDPTNNLPSNITCYIPSFRMNISNLTRANASSYFYGSTQDTSGTGIADTRVETLGNTSLYRNKLPYNFFTISDGMGVYSIFVIGNSSYGMSATKGTGSEYVSDTKTNEYIEIAQSREVNFVIMGAYEQCDRDCTYKSDSACHHECDGHNSCKFYNNVTMLQCDKQQVGWLVDYNSTIDVICCKGGPQIREKVSVVAVGEDREEKISTERVVFFRGRAVKFIADLFGLE
jgi:hypothetical protein